jgi:hypothetical protein
MATDGETADVWPDGYSADNADTTWNLNGRAAGAGGWANANGLPAAASRGGGWSFGTQAGAFALNVHWAPSNSDGYVGFRCARR